MPLLARACPLALWASLALLAACADPGVGSSPNGTGWNGNGNWWLDSSGRSPFDSGGGETDQDVVGGTDEDAVLAEDAPGEDAAGDDAAGPDDASAPIDDALGSDAGAGTDEDTADAGSQPDVAGVDTADAKTDAKTDTIADAKTDAGTDTVADAGTDAKTDTKLDTGGGGQWWDDPDTDAGTQPEPDTAGPAPDGSTLPGGGLCAPNFENTNVEVTSGGGGKLDIVIWVDTSGSMSQEAAAINQNLGKLIGILAAKGIDYRLVVFGSGLGLCSSGCPVNDSAHFLWVKQVVGSTNGPALISNATHFNKFKAFLRPDAVHHVIGVSDDNSSLQAATFVTNYKNLLKSAGLAESFVYHAIVSFVNPTNPEQSGNCPGGATYGSFHVQVAKATGGSTFQICLKDWTQLFEDLAQAIAPSAAAPCSHTVPVAAGKAFAPATLQVAIQTAAGTTPLPHVGDALGCGGAPTGWYYEPAAKPEAVHLCTDSCATLGGEAKLVFQFGCPAP